MGKIRVLIVDADKDVRHWLGLLIDRTEGFHCADRYSGLESLFQNPPAASPDLVLIEAPFPVAAGEALTRLRKLFPKALLALMDLDDGPNYENLARRMGADGFMSKARVPESLEKLRKRMTPSDDG